MVGLGSGRGLVVVLGVVTDDGLLVETGLAVGRRVVVEGVPMVVELEGIPS